MTSQPAIALSTYNAFLFAVRSNVLVEMVAAHEFLATFWALEPLFAGVRSTVSLQFVRARETFTAKHPRTNEWPFTYEANDKRVGRCQTMSPRKASIKYPQKNSLANIHLCAILNAPADVTSCRRPCYSRVYDRCAGACGQRGARLPYNWGTYTRLVSSVA